MRLYPGFTVDPVNDYPGVLSNLVVVGKVPRFVPMKTKYSPNPWWMRFNGRTEVEDEAAYVPGTQSLAVEKLKISVYDGEFEGECPISDDKLDTVIAWTTAHFGAACSTYGGPQVVGVTSVEELPLLTDNEGLKLLCGKMYDAAFIKMQGSEVLKKSCGGTWGTKNNPCQRVYQTKAEFYACPLAREYTLQFMVSLFTDDPYWVLFSACLKDELITREKNEEGRTRMFMGAPAEFHMACYIMFSDMHDKLMTSDATSCSAGSDYHYGQWDVTLGKMIWDLYYGIDFKEYDISMLKWQFTAGFRVQCGFFSQDLFSYFGKFWANLFRMALYSLFITSKGDIILKKKANPSGWFETLILNTFVLYLINACAWVENAPTTLLSRRAFDYYVLKLLCGDDQLQSVHKDVRSWWTPALLMDFYKRCGQTTKMPLEISDDIKDVQFCGKYSIRIFGVLCPVGRVVKFYNSLDWRKDADITKELSRVRAYITESFAVPFYRRKFVEYREYLYSCNPLIANSPQYGRSIDRSLLDDRVLMLGF